MIGTSQMVPTSMTPLGALLLGSLGTVFGIGTAFAAGGAALAVAGGVILLRATHLRALERRMVPELSRA